MTVAILDDADQGLALAQAQAELAQDKVNWHVWKLAPA